MKTSFSNRVVLLSVSLLLVASFQKNNALVTEPLGTRKEGRNSVSASSAAGQANARSLLQQEANSTLLLRARMLTPSSQVCSVGCANCSVNTDSRGGSNCTACLPGYVLRRRLYTPLSAGRRMSRFILQKGGGRRDGSGGPENNECESCDVDDSACKEVGK